jgi:hypothetical protein
MLANQNGGGNGTKVLGLADKRQSYWRLGTLEKVGFDGTCLQLGFFIVAVVDTRFRSGNQSLDVRPVLGDHQNADQ